MLLTHAYLLRVVANRPLAYDPNLNTNDCTSVEAWVDRIYLATVSESSSSGILCNHANDGVPDSGGAFEVATHALPSQTLNFAQGCKLAIGFSEAPYILQLVLFAVFSALRVYAVADRNQAFSLVILLLYVFPILANMILFSTVYVTVARYHIFGSQCNELWTWSSAQWKAPHLQRIVAVFVVRLPVIIADVLCVLMTWRKTASFSKRTPLLWITFRDGTIYFIVLFTMNVAQIVLETATFLANTNITPVATFVSVLTAILISRFILNLRQVVENRQSESRVSTALFVRGSSLLGNLGEPLEHENDEDVLDENEGLRPAPDVSGDQR
ncbi:hypothetical protein NM688_g3190 [Phlebia brevispora]|uniref:Uncharacterized protein n=1 Tax=Phlebia brevispora TaxID=194682 RepID=A0ACC1T6M3_9APHY|nr:hypothetical protein NM688_g3190 [Phlebia brevispora]